MNLTETNAFLTWVSQYDGRVNNTPAAVEIWQSALIFATVAEAKQAAEDHYRMNEAPPVSPGGIRKRCMTIQSTNEAKRRAITAAPTRMVSDPNSFRSRNPEEWDRLAAEGAEKRRADLAARGLV
jgi:hypothetical protein